MEESIDDELDTIMEETILERILGRPWTSDDFARTLTALTQLATDAASVEEVVNREVADLGATGAAADQLYDLLPDYFRMMMLAWTTVAKGFLPGDEDGGGDDVLCQFKTRYYAMEGVHEEDDDVCCVCLERLHRGLVAALHCKHEFHGECIGMWLHRGGNVCPLCKADALLF